MAVRLNVTRPPQSALTNRSHSVDESHSLTLQHVNKETLCRATQRASRKTVRLRSAPAECFTPAEEERFKCLNSIATCQHEEEAVRQDETRFAPELSERGLHALSDALNAPDSALFRHKVAYILGECIRSGLPIRSISRQFEFYDA